jgi:hypothetical protein
LSFFAITRPSSVRSSTYANVVKERLKLPRCAPSARQVFPHAAPPDQESQ